MLRPLAITLLLAVAACSSPAAAATIVTYAIDADSQYTYKPSPWTGIPGGEPSPYQLDFGLSGFVAVDYDGVAHTARVVSSQLLLAGNQPIQNSPPDELTQVTSPRVVEFLQMRLFRDPQPGAGYEEYAADYPNGLRLRHYADGRLALLGGVDNTPADGVGLLFDVSARPVPEPAAIVLAVASLAGVLTTLARRRCTIAASA